QRRLRGHASLEAAAAVDLGDAGDRLDADLSVSRDPGADASTPDWYRALQICRIQTQPVDQAGAQYGLLETGAALPRRHRIPGHQRCIDAASFVHCGEGGRLFWRYDAAIEGCEDAAAAGDLRHAHTKCQPEPPRKPQPDAL